jgi:hypothetical protein
MYRNFKTNVGGVLLAVMLRIMCIVRQLLLLVQAAWPLWMQSDICLQRIIINSNIKGFFINRDFANSLVITLISKKY